MGEAESTARLSWKGPVLHHLSYGYQADFLLFVAGRRGGDVSGVSSVTGAYPYHPGTSREVSVADSPPIVYNKEWTLLDQVTSGPPVPGSQA